MATLIGTFEEANLAATGWTAYAGAGDTCDISVVAALRGAKGLLVIDVSHTGVFAYRNPGISSAIDHIFLFALVHVNDSPADAASRIIGIRNDSSGGIAYVSQKVATEATTVTIANNATTPFSVTSADNACPWDSTHWIALEVYRHATAGFAKVYVDGALAAATTTVANNTIAAAWGRVDLGVLTVGGGQTGYFDAAAWGTALVGAPPWTRNRMMTGMGM